MSVEAVEAVVARAASDPPFQALLAYDPDAALHGYDVSVAERAALIAGDETKLQQLGVSPAASILAAELNREGSHIP